MAALLYFYPVPPPIKKTPANQGKLIFDQPLVPKATPKTAPKRRKPVAKKKKGLSLQWKFVIAGLLLILFSPLYYGYVLKLFSSTTRWILDIGEDPNYRTYKSYDIQIPKRYSIHGIDVSYYQGKIDWNKVKAMKEDDVSIKFAFIKATEGVSSVDPYFQRNWREAPKAGIICGAYHYFIPKKSGLWQARFFLQTVKFEAGEIYLRL
ncbi:GH25 family lysozyme [Pedobacter sp. NJ-S-72]